MSNEIINIVYKIPQSVEVAKDMVFPSRVLKRQLDDAQKKLRLMEEQLEAIRNQEDKDKRRRKRARVSYVPMLRMIFACLPIKQCYIYMHSFSQFQWLL